MSVRDYLKAMDEVMRQCAPGLAPSQSTLCGFYLERGQQMESRSFMPTAKRGVWKDVSAIGPKAKQCFYNAQKLVLAQPEKYVYVEGYVNARLIPIHHGWVMLRETLQLVDPTLKLDIDKRYCASNIVLGAVPKGWDYFGTTFEAEQVRRMWLETGNAGSVAEHLLYAEYDARKKVGEVSPS